MLFILKNHSLNKISYKITILVPRTKKYDQFFFLVDMVIVLVTKKIYVTGMTGYSFLRNVELLFCGWLV